MLVVCAVVRYVDEVVVGEKLEKTEGRFERGRVVLDILGFC